MTDRHRQGNRRFVFQTLDKNNKANLVSKPLSKYNMPSKILQSQMSPSAQVRPKLTESPSSMKNSPTPRQTNPNLDTSRTEAAPVRRVVVVRNTKNPQMKQGPVDIGDIGKPDSKILPVISDGKKSIYLIRRSIAAQDPVG